MSLFHFSTLVKHTIILYLRHLPKDYLYTVQHGLAKGLRRKGGFGFIPFNFPTREERFLSSLPLRGQTIYDIGGWEGVFTLFFARAAGSSGRVITFEPHPENYARIVENIRLNHFENVQVRPIALGKEHCRTQLASRHSEFGTASINPDVRSQILRERGARLIEVELDSLDNQIRTAQLPPPDFVKIDVEGAELDVLLGMSEILKQFKPKLHIEVHDFRSPRKSGNARAVVTWLASRGCSIYHIEAGRKITIEDDWVRNGDHLYCVYGNEAGRV